MGRTQISVNGILTIPKHKPDIQSILRICTTTIIDKTITMHKKIFFAGHVDISIEYVACSCDCSQPVHFLRCEIPFNGLLIHPFARERFNACLKTRIRFCEVEVTSSRTIETIMLLKLCKVKFHRIYKHKHKHYAKLGHGDFGKYNNCASVANKSSMCDSPASCECKPTIIYPECKPHDDCDCKPPSHHPECKPHDDCDCKPPSHHPECKPHDDCDCKPPSHHPECKPHDDCDCKPPSHYPECKPHDDCDCKPPSHHPECKPHDDCDCKPPSHHPKCKPHDGCDYKPPYPPQECKPNYTYDCKPPSYPQECKPNYNSGYEPPSYNYESKPHYSNDCKPPFYKHDYKSYHSGYSKSQGRDPVLPDGYSAPTHIQPYTRMGNSHGVAFGYNYEE